MLRRLVFKIPHIGNDVFTNYTRFDTNQTKEAALCIQVAAKFHLANFNDAIVKTLNATFKDVAKCSDFRMREYTRALSPGFRCPTTLTLVILWNGLNGKTESLAR